MTREGEDRGRERLVRRDSPGLVRRSTLYEPQYGGMVYYPLGSRHAMTLPPGRLTVWYRQLTEIAQKLVEFVERLEGGSAGSRQQGDVVDELILTAPGRLLRLAYLGRKAAHVVVLAGWAVLWIVVTRIRHLAGVD